MATTFIGTDDADTIAPVFVSPGVTAVGPDAAPGDADDVIVARGGDDTVAGGLGADVAALGAGDDVFGWASADGSDTVSGQAGRDTLVFDGDGSAERFVVSAAGGETRLDRDVGAVTMRLSGVERIDLLAGGGEDAIEIRDLGASALDDLAIDLAAARGDASGDDVRDRVGLTLDGADSFASIFGSGGQVFVSGLPAFVALSNADAADEFAIVAGAGADALDASGLSGGPRLILDAGAGDDSLAGGHGADLLIGGRGDDLVAGGRGDDAARLGAGFDGFFWREGDGSDAVDGGGGRDFLSFVGVDDAETFDLSTIGAGARLTRDRGGIVMDLKRVEAVTVFAGGGADQVTVGDLTGSGVRAVEISSSLPGRAGDGAADVYALAGGEAGETVAIASGAGSLVTVDGLPASVRLTGVEAADALSVSGGGGDDTLDAGGFAAGHAALTLDGGAGDDLVTGGAGDDFALGGDGDDRLVTGGGDDRAFGGRGDEIAELGDGDDLFGWAPGEGNDTVVGGAGTDTLAFDGSDSVETITIAAEGAAAVLLRDVGAVRMDLETVERVDLRVFGGTDEVRVGDLSATDLVEIVIDLGGPDGAADFIVVEGTAGADDVTLGVDGGAIVVGGLAAVIRILGAEGLDQLLFRGLGGDDRVDASALAGVRLFVQGGDGDDVILGSASGDTLSGDGGDDVILAGAGADALFGGSGDDFLDGGDGLDRFVGGGGDDVFRNGEIVETPPDGFLTA